MDLNGYILILKRRIWIAIVTLLVTLSVVTAGTFLLYPTYTASATVRIATASANTVNYTDYQYANLIINTYVNIATSQPLLDELNKQLGLAEAPVIEVKAIPNTELIEISVDDHNPVLAMNAANTLANILINQSSEVYTGSGKSPSEVLKEQVDQALNDLTTDQSNYNQLLTQTPGNTEIINNASKAVDLQQQLYSSLVSQYEQMKTKEAIQANLVSLVNPAILPEKPSKPNKPLNIAAGFFVGIIAGVSLAFLLDNLDSTLYSSEQITAVTKMRPIGKVPLIHKQEERKLPLDGNTPFGESFFRLRTNFLTLVENTPMRSFMISSSTQGEGKSSVISSLAYVLSQFGKKVIIVDCDLRLPTLHRIYDLPNRIGLTDFLIARAELAEVIQTTNFKGLYVITRGRMISEPIQFVDSPRMKGLVHALKQRFDFVLFDSPSVLAITDASVIASLVDGVLLVVKKGKVQKDQLEAALQQFSDVKANVIGLVVNGEKLGETYYQYYGRKKNHDN